MASRMTRLATTEATMPMIVITCPLGVVMSALAFFCTAVATGKRIPPTLPER